MNLDRLDRQILNLLQEDASISLRSLAEKLHASLATCQRRIARLKAERILLKEVAIVDRDRVGRPLTVFVSVELEKQNDSLLRVFEKRMLAEKDVLACYEVSGESDFLLIVNSASMESYHALTRRVFSSHNNVRNFTSNFAMNCSKFETKIPVDEVEAD
ncbi:Lrp/AsnC family transcriptional regulator [Undibacterium sp. TJN25]|uniref:Lrp/AsnC family transcriptional regulator n=1 Tax=Undibacterium sp. TJN25 TaxID=3413056 RepID=UPI003BF0EF8B